MIAQLGILRHRDNGTTPPPTGGELQIGTGGSLLYQHPINYNDDYGKNAYIFTTAEVGAAKTITGISFYLRSWSQTPFSYPNQVIKMGHVVQSEFDLDPDMNFADLSVSGFITVKPSFTQSIVNNNQWYQITFNTPFVYDGVNNLLIVWENNWGDWSSQVGGTNAVTATNRVAKKDSVTFPVTGNGTRSSNRPIIKLHY